MNTKALFKDGISAEKCGRFFRDQASISVDYCADMKQDSVPGA